MLRNVMKACAALVIAALVAWGVSYDAFAISVDQTRTMQFREFNYQMTHYYRITVNYNDANIGTPQAFGKLRQNTFLSNVACHVTTAFNAGTSNKFWLGTSTTNTNEIIASGTSTKTVTEGTAGYYQITQAGSLGVSVTSAADVTLYTKYVQTGTAATAGQVTCVLEYQPNNDM